MYIYAGIWDLGVYRLVFRVVGPSVQRFGGSGSGCGDLASSVAYRVDAIHTMMIVGTRGDFFVMHSSLDVT